MRKGFVLGLLTGLILWIIVQVISVVSAPSQESQDFLAHLRWEYNNKVREESISKIPNFNPPPLEPLLEPELSTELESPNTSPYYVDEYTLTAYCACENCCRGSADGITATGTIPVQGRTIAVDPKVIPYGTRVLFLGNTYIAEDCGGAIKGNRIDVYFDSHQEALEFGVKRNVPVSIFY